MCASCLFATIELIVMTIVEVSARLITTTSEMCISFANQPQVIIRAIINTAL